METKAEELQAKVQRFCSWCLHEWWEMLGRAELRRLVQGEAIGDCPSCHKPT